MTKRKNKYTFCKWFTEYVSDCALEIFDWLSLCCTFNGTNNYSNMIGVSNTQHQQNLKVQECGNNDESENE
jgi:hypothetical protein